jgi:uncharacterized damage-inducible protein DinB
MPFPQKSNSMQHMAKTTLNPLKDHLLELLGEGGAHIDFTHAIADLDPKYYNSKVPNVPHSPWDLLEHMRIAQADILAFTEDARHKSPKWPDEYWPTEAATPARWTKTVKSFNADRAAFIAIIKDPATDLLAPFPHGQGQTVAREAMLLADHTAYHLGQLTILRRALGAWTD